MLPVFREAVTLASRNEPFVIATVVRTKGSTPQKPGAKLLVRKDGSAVGTIGGGCVEGDIWFAAKEIMRNRTGPEYRDYYLNEEVAARDGLVCGGTMYFFIEPAWDSGAFQPIAQAIVDAYQGASPVALATLLKAKPGSGSAGAKALILADGKLQGSLGESHLDSLAVEAAKPLMEHGKCIHLVAGDGAELFVEAFTSPASLILMGGGHIARSVAPLARMLDLRLFVLDDRQEFASKERFPEAEDVVVDDYSRGLENFPITRNTAIVVATRGHRFDDLALEAATRSPAGYVGLVGSQRKVILIYEDLLKRGVPLERVREVHAPIGLDIGARSPEEIAVSIMAEIVQWRLGGTGQPMKLPERQLLRLHEKHRKEPAGTPTRST